MRSDVYRRLQQHFDGFPLRFPATESGVELRLLKHLFSPEEAEIALAIGCGYPGLFETYESLEVIFDRITHLDYSLEDVEMHLDNMVKKGSIMGVTIDGSKIYANALLIIGIYEFQVDKLTKEFQEAFDQYLSEAWGPANRDINVRQMRTIPVGIELEHENPIARYDDIKGLFEQSSGPFSIINCICRQSSDILGNPCQVTDRREVCMGMGEMARMYNELGWGREITKEEALGYLKQNEDDGLIFQLGNSQEMDFVCSCCSCCCGGLVSLKRIPNPADYTSSNYFAVIDEESCSGCGNCVERCQMDAITLEDDIANIREKRCIGCGNCIIGCPENAINLIVKDNPEIPPLTTSDLFSKITEAREKLDGM
ncbi:MAG: CoB--CoM heterodisulfide reductase iron-sulfur subunit A [Candidatus Thorarchaeota archaeon AB_25]|nr:MAG: CoB--CoM heterodisulfide reductase iron-sulfur subunit A [Candidatus Thorarchaeota archaeon AB_25]